MARLLMRNVPAALSENSGLQAAKKQGVRPQALTPASTAEYATQKEFGSDLDFHAFRLHSALEEAALDTQNGFGLPGSQQRCPGTPLVYACYSVH